ncbi:hypothetical protein Agub_g11852 [Astrephomene gubernaculifera]|uniref:PPIase cyclophilin-type domain-containing protein n=1 Tax=Astrephomene gubernaculifera TaxID=47775 RepID=A0AAD3HQZ1_9CHLO|nr:hypothetical protein Agub_g11852 [Astrephomene gubernaculifera]
MGKGGTKFVGDSVSVRQKAPANDTVRNIKRNLDKFLETGVHPEIERMRQEHANQLPALPDLDVHRPFVFLDIAVAGKPLGRLVVELFEDVVPVAASHFRNRCMPGSSGGIAGTSFHKLLPRYAIYGGMSSRAGDGVRLQPHTGLRAVEGGLVAVALSGQDFAIALDRALDLDRSHQVVGRIHRGRELLDTLGDLRTLPDDSPVQRVVVTRAGPTNHLGNHEDLEEAAAAAAGPPKDAATRLQEASEEARAAVMDALSEGLRLKRKADAVADDEGGGATAAAGPSTSGRVGSVAAGGASKGAPAASKGAAAAAQQARNVKAKMLDSMLGDLGNDDESTSSGSEGGDEGS